MSIVTHPATINTNLLNLRVTPEIGNNLIDQLPRGMAVTATSFERTDPASGYTFVYLQAGTWCGWAAKSDPITHEQYIDIVLPPPIVPPVTARYGFHILPGGDTSQVFALAKRGLVAGCTVMDDPGLANMLVAAGVPYVVFRHYMADGPDGNTPQIVGNASDIQRAKNWYNRALKPSLAGLDKRVIVSGPCEQNAENDGFWYIGFMQACEGDGFKAAIFHDGVGTIHLAIDSDQDYVSSKYAQRYAVGCMQYAKAGKHFNAYDAYGEQADSNAPASDPRDLAWFAMAAVNAYSDMPADGQADMLFPECGTFKASFVSTAQLIADFKGMNALVQSYPFVKAFMYWTLCPTSQPTWGRSSFDAAMPALVAALEG